MKPIDQKAFSLVEVTLAIGIIAFALVAIVGLIPVGLNASKEAVDETKATFIAQDAYGRIKGKISRAIPAVANDATAFDTYKNNTLPAPTASVPIQANNLTVAYLYDTDGKYLYEYSGGGTVPADASTLRKSNFYRAQVDICKLIDYTSLGNNPSGNAPYVDNSVLLAVNIRINWPANTQQDNGQLVNVKQTGKMYSFYLRRP